PIERVLKEFTEKLKATGYKIIIWDSSGYREYVEIIDLFYTADRGKNIRREVEAGGEPYIPYIEALVNRGYVISVYKYWQLNNRKNLTKWPLSGRNVDVILMPTSMPHVAVPYRIYR
ncbi:hypothetical protein A1O1_07581, partial [Capronia coronata CBS 617.96]